MKTIKLAQINPEIDVFAPELKEGIKFKSGKKCVLICDLETKTFKVENYYWFRFKQWLKL